MADAAGKLDELLDDESDSMTAWEMEFLDSLERQRQYLGAAWEPSDKQEDVLDRIWQQVFN